MKRLSRREVIIAWVCAVLCVLFVGKWIYSSQDRAAVDSPQTRMRILEHKIRQAKSEIAKSDAYDKRFERLTKDFGLVTSDGVEMSGVAARIDALARQCKVHVVNIKPLDPADQEFYRAYPVEVALDGAWEAIARFIYLAQAPETFLNVSRMDLEKYAEDQPFLRGKIIFTRIRIKPLSL